MSKGAPFGTGSRPTDQAADGVLAVPASIPSAVAEALQLVPKAVFDTWGNVCLEEPRDAWACLVDRFNEEARTNQQCADQLRRKADDAARQANIHAERAADFRNMAIAFANTPITFASRIEARSDETPQAAQPEGREPDPKGDAQP